MTERCYVQEDSNPPVCAIYDLQLKEHQSSVQVTAS